jgi:hypothetical protein
MSGNGTAVDAAAAVGEGDCIIEGDAFWASIGDAQHTTNKATAADVAYGRIVIMLFPDGLEQLRLGSSGAIRSLDLVSRSRVRIKR